MSTRRSSTSRSFNGKARNGTDADQEIKSPLNSATSASSRPRRRSIPSPDSVRQKILAEGRSARNLVTWSVPLNAQESKPRSKRQGKSRRYGGENSLDGKRGVAGGRFQSLKVKYNGPADAVKRTSGGGGGGGGGGQEGMHLSRDLKARYWSYLFDNLQRAVDEIYTTCEMDACVVQCEEVIMTVDVCRRDFQSLIDRIRLQEAFEKADEASRPTSLAWEVRKMSPRKPFPASPQDRHQPTHHIHHTTEKQSTTSTTSNQNQTVISWADRVRGVKPSEVKSQPECVETISFSGEKEVHKVGDVPVVMEADDVGEFGDKDRDGWETVRRSRPGKGARRRLENDSNFRVETCRDSVAERKEDCKQTEATVKVALSPEASHLRTKETIDDVNSHTDDIATEQLTKPLTENGNDDFTIEDSDIVREPDDITCQVPSGEVDIPNNDVIIQADDISIQDQSVDIESTCITSHTDDPSSVSNSPASNLIVKVECSGLSSDEDEELLAVPLSDDERPASVYVPMGDEKAVLLSDVGDESETSFSLCSSTRTLDWQDMEEIYDADAGLREATSWADRCESPPEARSPGRAIQLHQKLSSPSRRRSVDEHKKMMEEKQVKAQLQRDRLHEEKAEKLRIHTKKVQEVRGIKDQQLRQKRVNMEQRLLRAEQLRSTVLQERIRKAQEEEIKVSEIAFINSLEAQNKKMEMQEKQQGQETRLQSIEEERQRKREEQQAKEDAAQERKRALEAERLARLEEVKQKRKEQDAKVEQMLLERERSRDEAAKEKARERERRLEARLAAHQLSLEEKKKKIQSRQSETLKRYDQQLEQKKAKAACHSRHGSEDSVLLSSEALRVTPEIPHLMSTTLSRKFSSPNSSIGSSCHLSGSSLDVQEEASGDLRSSMTMRRVEESHALQERLKSLKKRAKKLRQRMSSKASSYESAQAVATPSAPIDSANKIRIQKAVKEIGKLLRSQTDVRVWAESSVTSLDKALTILRHCLEQKSAGDQAAFRLCGGFPALFRILLLVDISNIACGQMKPKTVLPLKSYTNACRVVTMACKQCVESCHYMLRSNKLGSIVDLLTSRLASIGEENVSNVLPADALASSLMELLATAMVSIPPPATEEFTQSRMDLVSYLVCQGVVERLHLWLAEIQKPIAGQGFVEEFVGNSLQLMVASTEMICVKRSLFDGKTQDSTQLALSLSFSNLLGILPLLYALLLHRGAPRYGSSSPPALPSSTIHITAIAFRLLNRIAQLDLHTLQTCLGTEGNSLEFQHVTGYVLWYCSKHKCDLLLHEAIELIGFFAVNNPTGQAFLQSGRSPTLLQLLCCLPFHYFSDPRLTRVLFPTLIAASYQCPANKLILEQEMSCVLLAMFIEEQLLLGSSTASNTTAGINGQTTFDAFASRFPVSEWEKASAFFRH